MEPASSPRIQLTEAQKREILRQRRLQKIQNRGDSFLVTAETGVAKTINKVVDSDVSASISSTLQISENVVDNSNLNSEVGTTKLSPSSSCDSLISQDKPTTELPSTTVNNSSQIPSASTNFEELETPPDTPHSSNSSSNIYNTATPIQFESVKILHLHPEVQTPNVVGIKDENSVTRDVFSPLTMAEAATPLLHQALLGSKKESSSATSNVSNETNTAHPSNSQENSTNNQKNMSNTLFSFIMLFVGIALATIHVGCLRANTICCTVSQRVPPIMLFFSLQLVFWFIPKSRNIRQQETGLFSLLMQSLSILQQIRIFLYHLALFLLGYMLCSETLMLALQH